LPAQDAPAERGSVVCSRTALWNPQHAIQHIRSMLAIFIPAFLSHTACDSLFPLCNGRGPVGSCHRPPAPEHAPRSFCKPTAPPATLHAASPPHLARKPHDAHRSQVNCDDPGRDPAIGPLADVAVGSASGSLVDAAAGNATGLEPSSPLRGEPRIATTVGPADVSTGGGPLALVALAVAGVGSYASGSAFIVGHTPVALDGQPLPRLQGTSRTNGISAYGSAGAASAVKAPTCDVAANLVRGGVGWGGCRRRGFRTPALVARTMASKEAAVCALSVV